MIANTSDKTGIPISNYKQAGAMAHTPDPG
jgi:hypothetical protein